MIHRFCFFLLLAAITYLPAQRLDRVEPPNWWVGMHHNTVELLLYGEALGDLVVTTDYAGVAITELKRVPNDNYLFVTLRVNPSVKPGRVPLVFSQQGREVLRHAYPVEARKPGRPNLRGFDASDVVYLVTPDRFANGDPENDEVAEMEDGLNRRDKGGRHGGDLRGVIDRLDYIAEQGYTALWLNPVLENAMPVYSYHGYAITDFYRVDPRYGSNELYRELVEKANARGVKVIIDLVANHCGLGHWWMEDLPQDDWVNQWAEFTQTNHRKTTLLDPYAADIDRKTFVDGWFVPTMPDLNQRNASMARYLIQNSIWWVEYAGLGGIRMDTYPYPDREFLTDWSRAIMAEYPNFNIVGEEWVERPTIIAYWQAGRDNPDGYRSYLPSVMDFPLQTATVKALTESNNWSSSWSSVYESLAQDYLYPDPHNLMIFPDNHDMSRIYTQLGEDFEAWKLAMTLFLTTRGIPQIYYGTEILMTNPGTEDHGVIRSDFPGGWAGDATNAFTGEGLSAQQREAQAFTRKLLNWRKNSDVIHHGKLLHYSPERNDVYVYFRYDDDETVMVVLNKNDEDVELDLGRFSQMLGSGEYRTTDILSGEPYSLRESLTVPARTPLVLSFDQ